MTWEIAFVIFLLLASLGSFIWEKIPTDVTALMVFAVLLLVGQLPFAHALPSVGDLLAVFSNPAPVTIGAMFILSAALEKAGVIDKLAGWTDGMAKLGYRGALVAMILMVATISAFINNTPVVVIFMPVVLGFARKIKTPASKLLIPLSYASIFGGVCTLVGTSTNLLASGVITAAGEEPLGMFELTRIGVPLLVICTTFLVVFGHRLIPHRETLTAMLSEEERKEFLTEAYVRPGSRFIGQTVRESGLIKARQMRVVEIVRNGIAVRGDTKDVPLLAGDRLVIAARPQGVAHATTVEGLNFSEGDEGLETISAHSGAIVEGVIGPRSSLAGHTIREINFRQRFRMVVLALHRRGMNLRDQLETVQLERGDTLLLMGTDQAREALRNSDDLLLLDRPPTHATANQKRNAWIVSLSLFAVIASVTLGLMPIAVASIVAVAVVFLTGCLQPKDGYAAIEWSILALIYGMLGLGAAMESTGASKLLADLMVQVISFGPDPAWQPFIALAVLYFCTSVLTEVLSNNATVVLMAPIALSLAHILGLDPRPFIIAICVGSSASFATPIGYQTNTYVYGVGGYKFADFLKVGLPLNFVYFIASVILIPMLWPFQPR
ncbi:MAG: SLC13 family permease [Verrucomicrobiota bacterium JB022]|nr:SLC13 family permease [Verrucomicrobiota bacterium JB022]